MASIESRDQATIFIHLYRAMVGRADIWRMRMDATTNWAIGATAAISSFALGNPDLPHYVVLMASLLTLCFLMLEARRLTFYHLWQTRVLQIEKGMILPALNAPSSGEDIELDPAFVAALSAELGGTVPTMPMRKAAARRLRRVYLYLFAAQWLAWILKLSTHPKTADSASEMIARAGIAGLPGAVCFGGSLLALAIAFVLALTIGGIDPRRDKPDLV
ncbi:MAG: DUF2270 domain-containing protein [Myxococcota bacterium]